MVCQLLRCSANRFFLFPPVLCPAVDDRVGAAPPVVVEPELARGLFLQVVDIIWQFAFSAGPSPLMLLQLALQPSDILSALVAPTPLASSMGPSPADWP